MLSGAKVMKGSAESEDSIGGTGKMHAVCKKHHVKSVTAVYVYGSACKAVMTVGTCRIQITHGAKGIEALYYQA